MAVLDPLPPGHRHASRLAGAHVLVAIPTLNEAAHIESCVRSLMIGDRRLSDVQFVVSDGGSTDETRDIVRDLCAEFPNLELIDNPDRLQAAAVNRVARDCAGDDTLYLVRCDAHSIYPPGYVMQVADALLRTGAHSVVTPMDAVGSNCFQKANAWVVDTPLGSGGSAHRGGRKSGFVEHGHHAGFELETFLTLDGYDETFSHNEDAEYDRRVTLAGGQIFLDATIRIAYAPRATVPALARQYFNYGKGRARNMLKHSTWPRLRQLAPVINLIALVVALAAAPFMQWALAYPAVYFSALAVASIAMAVAKRSLCGLLAGAASAVMHVAWASGFLRQVLRGR